MSCKNYKSTDWQIKCDETIKDKNYVILSMPTGSGKTDRYKNWAFSKKERPIFITAPIKSLSNQRFRELYNQGYKVGLETGDVRYMPYYDVDIICCTQEIYLNKYINIENSTLIIDEFSYIYEDQQRARNYIDSLYHTKANNIIICSATFGNPQKIKEHINFITNKNFYLYNDDKRLTTLTYKGYIDKYSIKDSLVVCYSKEKCIYVAEEIFNYRLKELQDILKNTTINATTFKNKNKNEVLLVANKYGVVNKELLDYANLGVVYYYGGMFPKEKMFVEELFERRLVDTVVGTDALALGVNFPIKNVVFTELQKEYKGKKVPVGKNLFEQLSGRAGRKGFFDDGFVYYCSDFLNLNKKNTNDIFWKLVNEKDQPFTIHLTPNIKNILLGETNIEQEVDFVSKYSTDEINNENEYERIIKIIDYIKNYDVAYNYMKTFYFNFNYDNGLENAFINSKNKDKYIQLTSKLMHLQTVFNEEIKYAYLSEYDYKKNCLLLTDVLLEIPIEKLIKKYGLRFYDILLLRKYLYKLPERLTKNYDLSLIDNVIDTMDHSVLHPEDYKMDAILKKAKMEHETKEDNIPIKFDRIIMKKKEYIVVLRNNNEIYLCPKDSYNNPFLKKIPINSEYKIVGKVRASSAIKYINKINLNNKKYCDSEDIEKVKKLKHELTKKYL